MFFYQHSYFPPNFKYLGYIGLFGGIVLLLTGKVIVGLPIFIISLVLSFTRYGCKVNYRQKTITEFVSILGIKTGSAFGYKQLHKIVLKKEEISQVLNSRGSSTTLYQTMYNGYLFYDDQYILLQGNKNKNKMLAIMEKTADFLSLPLEQY